MQNQLQMISPINNNHKHEKILKSVEVKPKVSKPSILIPLPTEDNSFLNISSNKIFAGKEKQDVIHSALGSLENIEVITKPTTDEYINNLLSSLNTSIFTESTKLLLKKNYTTPSFLLSTVDSSKYNQNLKNLQSHLYTERTSDVPLINTNDKYKRSIVSNLNKSKSVKNNNVFEKQKKYFLSKIKSLPYIILR